MADVFMADVKDLNRRIDSKVRLTEARKTLARNYAAFFAGVPVGDLVDKSERDLLVALSAPDHRADLTPCA